MNNEIVNLQELDIKTLKSIAYDLLVEQQRVSLNLQAVNKQIEVVATREVAPEKTKK